MERNISEALAIVHASSGEARAAMLIKLLQIANSADEETRQVRACAVAWQWPHCIAHAAVARAHECCGARGTGGRAFTRCAKWQGGGR